MPTGPSEALCLYLGRLEVEAHGARDSYDAYRVFSSALESLPGVELSPEERILARDILRNRARDTKPHNLGCACGEAGEAD